MRLFLAGCVALVLFPAAARASILASESFVYGAVGGDLVGNNGGSGFSGAWADSSGGTAWDYQPLGLSFGSLSVAGGAANRPAIVGANIVNRPFSSSLSGTIYGAFLFQINARPDNFSTAAVILGAAGDSDVFGSLTVNAPGFDSANGEVRVEDSGEELAGDPLALNTTYLALFRFDSVANAATAWFLTSGQYENFVAGGLNEADLNSAGLGSANTNVLERGSTTGGDGPLTHLNLYGVFAEVSVTYDEIRLSDASLAEAAPSSTVPGAIPEAASLVTWAMLALVACPAMLWARRRMSAA
jgi:hypothetical protein